MKVRTKTHFDAAHRLDGYDGDCANLHGHTFEIEVEAEGNINPSTGMAVDFRRVKEVVEQFDHTYINDNVDFRPTAEHLCKYFLDELADEYPELRWRVRVYESSESYAEDEYEPSHESSKPSYITTSERGNVSTIFESDGN